MYIEVIDKPTDFVHLDKTDFESSKYNNYIESYEYKNIPNFWNSRYKNIYCVNCGEKGHVVKYCKGPITSYGIISFKIVKNPIDEICDKNKELRNITRNIDTPNVFPKVKLLMIQRKDTMGYIDFVRGKYSDFEKDDLLKIWLNEMTKQEKHNLLSQNFDTIWNNLWVNHESKCYKNEYDSAKHKFEKLDIKQLIDNSITTYTFQEFSFPKGRKNMKENNQTCAEREFFEETGYNKNDYTLLQNYPTIHEEFIGTNGVKYKHVYYIVKMKDNIKCPSVDYNNLLQIGEVKNIGWFNYDECMTLIRPYDVEKKNVVDKVYKLINDSIYR